MSFLSAVEGGVAIGAHRDYSAAKQYNKVVAEVKPNPEHVKVYQQLYPIFKEAYTQLVPVYEQLAHTMARKENG